MRIPGSVEPLFKGVELPEEKEETNIKKYRSLVSLEDVYANLFNSELKAVELYNFYDYETDTMVNYNEDAFKADCVEYLLELGIDLKANKLSLYDVIRSNYGSHVDLCNAYAINNSYGYVSEYEPPADHIYVNNVLSRALFKLQRKEKGLEEVTASNILELGIKLDKDDFYPVNGNDDLLEYSMVEGVYLYTDICNAEPDEDGMVEPTVQEYLENISDCLADVCKDEARKILKLDREQEIKFRVVEMFQRGGSGWNHWNVETTALVRVL
jgi:hypothetical protein